MSMADRKNSYIPHEPTPRRTIHTTDNMKISPELEDESGVKDSKAYNDSSFSNDISEDEAAYSNLSQTNDYNYSDISSSLNSSNGSNKSRKSISSSHVIKDTVRHRRKERYQIQDSHTYPQKKTNASAKRNYTYEEEKCQISQKYNIKIYCMTILFIGFLCILAYLFIPSQTLSNEHGIHSSSEISIRERISQLKYDVGLLKSDFPAQDNSIWDDFIVGTIEILQNPKKPSIFVLLSNETSTLHCLVASVSNVISQVLNSGSLKLTSTNLEKDHGGVIYTLRSKMKNARTIIVENILTINPDTIKAFHSLCDTENAVEKGTVFFIIMILNQYDVSKRAIEVAEEQLHEVFSPKIDEDTLWPLITRLTDGTVFYVREELELPRCK
ncbi:uncharacterized protein LOC105703089 [Orussus abietinus]|uniref:uncharacterized protein LOC105703089 n=1 Tax=Orussus abietinus TaxID=222816 RepID=UPI000625FB1D|nr:uncharacterized protein LOC105703089 [Orussus abietinus]XP_012286615.1 uncharacterized protein LOC105703089 [Orussus abietinus]XP_012286616.1 uncharacterized protein LOC105703089 [Orussus abietinus]